MTLSQKSVPKCPKISKNNQKSIVDECTSHVTLFIQALSLEFTGERRFATLASLAISISQVMSNVEFINNKRQPAMNTLSVQNDTITEVGTKMQRPAFWNMYLSLASSSRNFKFSCY